MRILVSLILFSFVLLAKADSRLFVHNTTSNSLAIAVLQQGTVTNTSLEYWVQPGSVVEPLIPSGSGTYGLSLVYRFPSNQTPYIVVKDFSPWYPTSNYDYKAYFVRSNLMSPLTNKWFWDKSTQSVTTLADSSPTVVSDLFMDTVVDSTNYAPDFAKGFTTFMVFFFSALCVRKFMVIGGSTTDHGL